MKKLFITLACVVGIVSASNAQKTFIYGVKSGLNISGFSSGGHERLKGLEERYSFHLGGLAALKISDEFGVQTEVLYSSQGAAKRDKDKGFKDAIKLDYIHIPLMIKYEFWKGVSLDAGPYMGILTSARSKKKINGEKSNTNFKNQIKPYDYGFGIGASAWDGENIMLGLRVCFSNEELLKEKTEYKTGQAMIQISGAYIF